MAQKVTYSPQTLDDLRDILLFHLQYTDLIAANRLLKNIRQAIIAVLQQPMVGLRVTGFSEKYRHTNVLKAKYKVYYKILDQTNILVLRVWPTSRKSLTPNEIKP